MKMIHLGALVSAAALGLGGLLFGGCGIIFGPATFAAAVATNSNFTFAGHVVDMQNQPINDSMVQVDVTHLVWAPIEGLTNNDNKLLRKIGPTFTFQTRGTDTTFTFTHDGYEDRTLKFYSDTDTVIAPEGNWPNVKDFPVVMLPAKKSASKVIAWNGDIDYAQYPSMKVIHLPSKVVVASADNAADFPPGTLYLTLKKGTPHVLDAKGNVDPAQVNLPENITLHVAGKDSGLLPIQPKIGFPPLGTAVTAPTEGYFTEITIDRSRLVLMRSATSDNVMDSRVYFYFKADGHYGKGSIAWSHTMTKDQKDPVPLEFSYKVWTQPVAGSTDLAGPESCECK